MKKLKYFLVSLSVIAADQLSKFLVVKNIPEYSSGWSCCGDFFRLVHVRNLGVAFSIGNSSPEFIRVLFMIILPLIVLAVLGIYIVKGKNIPGAQRWVLSVILGGGFGNLIDRLFRRDGVVDFLDFEFYGLFGLERWPTFNIADASLVISSIILVILMIQNELRLKKNE
jgi:signal peptidase II